MDDCSPDNTPEVVRTFSDNRIKYIRNDVNLGHTRNFNKGISVSSGKYVWIISPDDFLKSDHILDRYVTLMESNYQVGYVFCPSIAIENDIDYGLNEWTYLGPDDTIFEGKEFLHKLIKRCVVSAGAVMARRECYDKVGLYPSDLVYGEDWHMWCAFAFHYDVGYVAEPMVCYRRPHVNSITYKLSNNDIGIRVYSNFSVLWRIRKIALDYKLYDIAKECLDTIVNQAKETYVISHWLSIERVKECIANAVSSPREVRWLCAELDTDIGDYYYNIGNMNCAAKWYKRALAGNPYSHKVFIKYLLLNAGKPGMVTRALIALSKRVLGFKSRVSEQ